MVIDSKLAELLSDFSLDIAKAFFIATVVAPFLEGNIVQNIKLAILFKGLISAILFLGTSRFFLEFKSKS